MADMVSGAASKAGQAAKGYAAATGGSAIGGAVMDQAALGDISKLGAGDVAGQASKVATNAVKGAAGDVTKRLTEAGGGVMAAGEEAMTKGMNMFEDVLDAAELGKLMDDMSEWAEKHPKLAVCRMMLHGYYTTDLIDIGSRHTKTSTRHPRHHPVYLLHRRHFRHVSRPGFSPRSRRRSSLPDRLHSHHSAGHLPSLPRHILCGNLRRTLRITLLLYGREEGQEEVWTPRTRFGEV